MSSILHSLPAIDAQVIFDFAQGNEGLREVAIGIFRKHAHRLGHNSSPEMRFMSEVDSPASDAVLRRCYRNALLESRGVTPAEFLARPLPRIFVAQSA